MALRNIKYYLSCTIRDTGGIGIVKTDQLELTEVASTPTVSLSNGRIFLNSTDDTLYVRIGAAWKRITVA